MDETLELEMLLNTRQRLLQAGVQAYEISNYAVPGQECRHNLNYWHGGDYVALGPSGASHLHGLRGGIVRIWASGSKPLKAANYPRLKLNC